jgi:hypothetical protein
VASGSHQLFEQASDAVFLCSITGPERALSVSHVSAGLLELTGTCPSLRRCWHATPPVARY